MLGPMADGSHTPEQVAGLGKALGSLAQEFSHHKHDKLEHEKQDHGRDATDAQHSKEGEQEANSPSPGCR